MKKLKLGRATDQRMAILRNQTTALLWNGRIETTAARARAVRSMAEKIITDAMDVYDQNIMVNKEITNDKGQTVTTEVRNDSAAKLNVRRRIMQKLYRQAEPRKKDENKAEYRERTGDINHPLIEKIFGEIAPKYAERAKEKGSRGGYTRILKMGPRRGDAAEVVILELI